jgi:class 3 adenylate cyclase
MSGEASQKTMTETCKLAAIMFTDMVGFSRQMGADETRMLRLLDVHNQLIRQAVAEHHGAVIKTVGDAFLEVIRLSPNWSTETWKQRAPVKDPAVIERFVAGARKARLK